jgi:uncharacterized protein with LGFP repeats
LVNGHIGQLGKLVGRALISLAATVVAAVFLTPVAAASPASDADDAITAAWDKAGGDTSVLGAKKGDVYAIGDGFAQDFANGKMFYTPDTGAKLIYGPILDKYESLGGPAGSDLGFPNINEVPGLAGPDSRVSTFSASDKPVIFWTPDHGAFVVRGAINAAWDKLGSSGGVLGVPVGDETYDDGVVSQKFSGGAVSWNRQTKEFTTEPAVLAEQLKGLQVAIDPTAAINMAWRAAGGATGPLGAKQGGQYPIGGDGIAQDFVGGKVFFSPDTGANAVESDILAKYESLGGPVGSDLGFPTANESDGGIGPSSRICTFSAADKPVIFWTSDHGAFVVRGAMKAAWDKLRGPTGKLGAPVGDQAVDGDVVSQKFTGGMISWNRTKNTFSTDPPNLAPLLSGLQVPGQNQPSAAAMPPHANKFTWHRWWLVAAVSVLLLIVISVLVAFGWRRRRTGHGTLAYQPDHDFDVGYEAPVDGHWVHDDIAFGSEQFQRSDLQPPEHPAPDAGSAPRVSWPRGAGGAAGLAEEVPTSGAYGGDLLSGSDEGLTVEAEDLDAVDTTPTPVVSDSVLAHGVLPDVGLPEAAAEAAYPEGAYPEEAYAEEAYAEEAYAEEAYAEEAYAEEAHPDVAAPDGVVLEAVVADAVTSGTEARTGRHAAVEPADAVEAAFEAATAAPAAPAAAPRPSPAVRPTIHLPLDDPYQAPDGYPIKANASFGLYYTPGSPLYQDTLAEIWLANEEVAEANGFMKAD